MLRDAQMAGLVKLHCGEVVTDERQEGPKVSADLIGPALAMLRGQGSILSPSWRMTRTVPVTCLSQS